MSVSSVGAHRWRSGVEEMLEKATVGEKKELTGNAALAGGQQELKRDSVLARQKLTFRYAVPVLSCWYPAAACSSPRSPPSAPSPEFCKASERTSGVRERLGDNLMHA